MAQTCQYCDAGISKRSAIVGFCRACADELRNDPDRWGDMVRAGESRADCPACTLGVNACTCEFE